MSWIKEIADEFVEENRKPWFYEICTNYEWLVYNLWSRGMCFPRETDKRMRELNEQFKDCLGVEDAWKMNDEMYSKQVDYMESMK